MKKKLLRTLSIILFIAAIILPIHAQAANSVDMYRMYNPNSGEHFYTSKASERDSLVSSGWKYEGTGWSAPASGNAVYRLYDANSGDHFYTVNADEKNALTAGGWSYEGIGWYSGGSVPVYRAYNPNAKAGSHNYTTNKGENNALVANGWKDEGIAWYALGQGKALSAPATPSTTPPTSPPPASKPSGYAPETIYVSGKVIPFKEGGMANGQAIIDSDPDGIASTWGGKTPFSGTDGLNTHFIGHHWGAFDPFINLQVGQTVTITDSSGKPFVYAVKTVAVVDTRAVDTTTGRSLYGEITSTGGGERVVFQTCMSETLRRILFCQPA